MKIINQSQINLYTYTDITKCCCVCGVDCDIYYKIIDKDPIFCLKCYSNLGYDLKYAECSDNCSRCNASINLKWEGIEMPNDEGTGYNLICYNCWDEIYEN